MMELSNLPQRLQDHPYQRHGDNVILHTRHGNLIFNIHDKFIGRSMIEYGEFSYGEFDLFDQLIPQGGLVLDVGANIGTHTLYFSKCVGPTGFVMAFEPQRLIFQMLCGNLAINSIENVYAYQAGIAQENRMIHLPSLSLQQKDDVNFGGFDLQIAQNENGEPVPLKTIDSLELPACHLIKVDVEGMEINVLNGAKKTIEQYRPFLYLEDDRPEQSEALKTLIQALGYTAHQHVVPLYRKDNFYQNPINHFAKPVYLCSFNLICIPNESALKIIEQPLQLD